MPSRGAPERIKEANVRYHDAAAGEYDSKWAIDFGPIGQQQVRAKVVKALGSWPDRSFGQALEIGAGTGYFSLNLLQLGVIDRLTAADISTGMLAELRANADRLGLEVETVTTDAEHLPFEDGSFDLVCGHAVLHHLPSLEAAFSELHRVLRPGGALAFCGEPSRYGDLLANIPKRGAFVLAPFWRRLVGAPARPPRQRHGNDGRELEREVDVHSFSPRELRSLLRGAGFADPRVSGEELLANLYGWTLRTLEHSAEPGRVPVGWQRFAFRSYLAVQRLDAALFEPRLPASLLYNLVLSARRPSTGGPGVAGARVGRAG
jgi:ubiquinone/menaquinone biosynthesis C-methylase UbiE